MFRKFGPILFNQIITCAKTRDLIWVETSEFTIRSECKWILAGNVRFQQQIDHLGIILSKEWNARLFRLNIIILI